MWVRTPLTKFELERSFVQYKASTTQPLQLYSPINRMSKSGAENFELALSKTKLDDIQKVIFQQRFIQVLKTFERRCLRISWFFHILRILISVGSLIVPALLSIQYADTSTTSSIKDPESFAYEIYWATWVISLLVTTSNGIVSVFKVDKKYFFLHTTMEQLRSEGWQYLELSGRYSGFHTPGKTPTHDNQFIYFCHAVEKIKMHQVEEEYFKLTESHAHSTSGTKQDGKVETKDNPLYHPTPQASLEELAKTLPLELRKQLKSVIQVDGAIAPSLSVSAELSSASSQEKALLRVPSNTQVSEGVSA